MGQIVPGEDAIVRTKCGWDKMSPNHRHDIIIVQLFEVLDHINHIHQPGYPYLLSQTQKQRQRLTKAPNMWKGDEIQNC